MAALPNQDYLLPRNKKESTRLDEQHEFLVAVMAGLGGNPIHTSIPLESLHAIADVATGTGCWLEDVRNHLDHIDSSISRYYHGFDISSAQFISDTDIPLSIHDLLKPFPAEHLNRYDLVHVRLVMTALRIEDYATAASNMMTLLKPGGYLQWDEYDSDLYEQTKVDEYPTSYDVAQLLYASMKATGKSEHPPQFIKSSCRSEGFINIQQYNYGTLAKPELHDLSRKWGLKLYSTMLPTALRILNPELDEAAVEEKATGLIAQVKSDYYDAGVILSNSVAVVVSQKPPASA